MNIAWGKKVACSVLVCSLLGCAKEGTEGLKGERDPNERPILKVLMLYASFQRQHSVPPKSAEELKAWAKKLPKTQLESMQITDIDKTFISPRDNQPFIINPANAKAMGGMSRVVVYERTGVEGKRQTASTMGTVDEMDEENIRKYVPNFKKG